MLFCRFVQAGDFLHEYCGEIMSGKEAYKRALKYKEEGSDTTTLDMTVIFVLPNCSGSKIHTL